MSSEDINVEDDASTQPANDDPKLGENYPVYEKKFFIALSTSFLFFFFFLKKGSIVLNHFKFL